MGGSVCWAPLVGAGPSLSNSWSNIYFLGSGAGLKDAEMSRLVPAFTGSLQCDCGSKGVSRNRARPKGQPRALRCLAVRLLGSLGVLMSKWSARNQAQGPESPVGSSISLGSFQVPFFLASLVQKVKNVSVRGDLVESINLELANNASSWKPLTF